MMPVQTDGPDDYKTKYKTLKRKLKLLIYENECFQEELRKAQRSLLRVRRDKSFLLDRLLQYHRGPDSSSDSEQTEESDTEMEGKIDAKSCRKRLSLEGSVSGSVNTHGSSSKPPSKKKKSSNNSSSSSSKSSKHSSSKQTSSPHITLGSGVIGSEAQPTSSIATSVSSAALLPKLSGANLSAGALAALSARRQVGGLGGGSHNDGQLSREEVERRLAARQPMNDFTTTVSLTLPNQLFSDNIMEGDLMDDDVETSPSNIEEDVTVDNYD